MTAADAPPTLSGVAGWIALHRRREQDLFELCGAWSATGDRVGARGFFASQSAFHAWRAEQWERRAPRSVSAGGGEVPAAVPASSWAASLRRCAGLDADAARVGAWAHALVPALVVGYRRHGAQLAPAADAGVARLLELALDDVLRQWVQAQELLAGWADPGAASAVDAGLAEVLPALWERSP